MTRYLYLLSFLSLLSCHSGEPKTAPGRVVDMKGASEDLLVPPFVWTAIDKGFGALLTEAAPAKKEGEEKGEGEKEEKSEEKKGEKAKPKDEEEFVFTHHPTLQPLPLTVLLTEKTVGVLGGANLILKYSSGGGSLNYQRIINEKKKGTFYLKVQFEPTFNAKVAKVFYVSDTVTRERDGHVWGNGCGRLFDLTHYFQDAAKHDGVVLNTVGDRHVSVSAGTYFFLSANEGKLQISQLVVTDSAHHELLCQKEKL